MSYNSQCVQMHLKIQMCIQSSSRTQSKLPQLSVRETLLHFITGAFKHRSTMFFWHFHQVLLPSGLSHVIWQADFPGLTLPLPDVPVLFPTLWTGLPSAWPSLGLLPACYQLHEFFSSLGVFIFENYQELWDYFLDCWDTVLLCELKLFLP